MSSSDASTAPTFTVRTAGNLLGRGRRTVTVAADGLVFEPGGKVAWSDFACYRGVLPSTLIHRDGRRLTISQARNNNRSIADMQACLKAIAQAIDDFNAGREPAAHLALDLDGEYRAAKRQRAGMVALSLMAIVLSVVAWNVPAPIPTVAKFLPLTIALVAMAYATVLNRRLRELDSQRRKLAGRR